MKNEHKLTLNDISEFVNVDIYKIIYNYWKNCYYCGVSKYGRIFTNDGKLTCTDCLINHYIQLNTSDRCYRYVIMNKKLPKNYANVYCNITTYVCYMVSKFHRKNLRSIHYCSLYYKCSISHCMIHTVNIADKNNWIL